MNAKKTSPGSDSLSFAPAMIAASETGSRPEPSASASAAEPGAKDCTQDVVCRSDAHLISSVCRDPPDEKALELLVNRYWSYLISRCQMLTLNQEKAHDLAQSVWYRLLRARQRLKAEGRFPAYLVTIATNLFRDIYRASRRAGPMADSRLESLEALRSNEDGKGASLAETLVDMSSSECYANTLLNIDIDGALEQLSPDLRDVVTARFIIGESCAEIGFRRGRTEQTVSRWVRQALIQMKNYLEDVDGANDTRNPAARDAGDVQPSTLWRG
jgi:RNA polymerase sigma factor (sigma-70 family)